MRRENDHYPTPHWVTDALLRSLPWLQPTLDPCCGSGEIMHVARRSERSVMRGMEIDVSRGMEAQQRGFDVTIGDALRESWHDQHILTNPPFSRAMEFLVKAMDECPVTAVLLRLGYQSSKARMDWWRAHPPSWEIILSKRPSFTGTGTDSQEYGWFVWSNEDRRGTIKGWVSEEYPNAFSDYHQLGGRHAR